LHKNTISCGAFSLPTKPVVFLKFPEIKAMQGKNSSCIAAWQCKCPSPFDQQKGVLNISKKFLASSGEGGNPSGSPILR
jgi:hypothetical protein